MINSKIEKEIRKIQQVKAPQWTPYVKTSVARERPPDNSNWWHIRVASVFMKIQKFGPIGTNRLSKQYGGRKNRGHKPEKKFNGSRNIIRKSLQQLQEAGLIKHVSSPSSGKIVTKKGRELVNKVKES